MHMIARGLRENRVFLVTSILILFILLIAFLAPHIAPYDPLSASMKDANLAPSSSHIFGTDKLGRDVFSRILCGAGSDGRHMDEVCAAFSLARLEIKGK